MTVINIQTMRYINLLDITSSVKTRKCFFYNNMIIFAVPKELISKAIGPGAVNVRRIQEKLGKRVRIIAEAEGIEDLERFSKDVVAPLSFKAIEIKDDSLILTAGSANKAALLGRNKRRYEELRQIIYDTFNLNLKII